VDRGTIMLRVIVVLILIGSVRLAAQQELDTEFQLVRYSELVKPPFEFKLRYVNKLKLNLTSTSFSNWRQNGGADDNITIGIDYNLDRTFSYENWSFLDQLMFRYAVQKLESKSLEKTMDLLQYKTKLNYKAVSSLYYTAEITAQTQLTNSYDGEDVVVSTFLAPIYTSLGVGASFNKEYISVYLSPITGRITSVLDQTLADKGLFGVAPAQYSPSGVKIRDGANHLVELGLLMDIDWKFQIMKNMNSRQKIRLYSDYQKSFGVYDVDWQSTVEIKVNDLFTVDLRFHMVYDEDIKTYEKDTNSDGKIDSNDRGIAKTQFLSYIAVAMLYKF